MLLATLHIIIILEIIAVPEDLMDPVLVLGQRIVDSDTDAMKTIVTALYGVQGLTWCVSLICLANLRLAIEDLTLGFEIQNPRRKSTVHILTSQQSIEANKRSSRISQRFFNVRQSAIAPLELCEITNAHEQEKESELIAMQPEIQYELKSTSHEMHELQVGWTKEEKRASNDSKCIYIPRGRQISQVVVTFRDDSVHSPPQRTPTAGDLTSKAANAVDVEARAVSFNTNSCDLRDLVFDKLGEPLSDIVFKAVEPLKAVATKVATVRVSNGSNFTDGDTKAGAPSISPVTTLDDHTIPENEYISKFSSEDFEKIADPEDKDEGLKEYQDQFRQHYKDKFKYDQTTFNPLVKESLSYPIIPRRLSSIEHEYITNISIASSSTHRMKRLYRIGEDNESDGEAHDPYCYNEYHNDIPNIQSNTSASHYSTTDIVDIKSITANAQRIENHHSKSSFSPLDKECNKFFPVTKSKPSLASLQNWPNQNSGNNDNTNDRIPGNSSPTPVAFSVVDTFTKKEKQTPISPSVSTAQPLVIPTIVLHPDDEDDEPIRVLSDIEIEYLSTMPPVPLRTLTQPWDEVEYDYYDGDNNDCYDYDDHRPKCIYDHEEEEGENTSEESEQSQVDMSPSIEGEYDPYALDVPFNLEIDLQGLE
ncbi:hypothetical protein BGZ49_000353 [Haplosporangium sp. Z 27]|nr:hypothetical protein BGZ49_000353 [Haplosporangium sp. Z 27]